MDGFVPRMAPDRAAHLRRWHERVSSQLRGAGDQVVEHLGLRLHVPAGVFPPQPMSRLLGQAVIDEVRPGGRVLDMGTGCGVNAVLAARHGARVEAVDVNPAAVAAATTNAHDLVVADLVHCRVGDLFDGVEGRFDLIVFDPPFRWFAPDDLLDRAITDDGYRTLTEFITRVPEHLEPDGRVLLLFGTTGDIDFLHELLARSPLHTDVRSSAVLGTDVGTETYWVFRLDVPREPGVT